MFAEATESDRLGTFCAEEVDEGLELLQAKTTLRRSLILELLEPAASSGSSNAAQLLPGTRVMAHGLAVLTLAGFLGCCAEWLTRGKLHRSLAALMMLAECLTIATYTVAVPMAYDFSKHLGNGTTFSGFLVSAPFALFIVGACFARYLMTPWCQGRCRYYVLRGFACFGVVTAACAFVAHPPHALHLSSVARSLLLLLLRTSYGLFDSTGEILQMMIVKTSPPEELTELLVSVYAAGSFGFGVGPLLSSFVDEAVGSHSVEVKACLPMALLAGFWALLVWALASQMPQQLLQHGESAASEQSFEDTTAERSSPVTEESPDLLMARKAVFWLALAYSGGCAMLNSSLEAGTSLIFERDLGLGAQAVGLLLGAAFCLAAPLMVLIGWALKPGQEIPRAAALCPVLAAACLFRIAPAAMGLTQERVYVMLLADILLFAMGSAANGTVDSIALQHSSPQTWFCQENYIIAAAALRAVGSFLGPPCVRLLITAGGQDCSATMQLTLALLGLACFLAVRAMGARIETAEADSKELFAKIREKLCSATDSGY